MIPEYIEYIAGLVLIAFLCLLVVNGFLLNGFIVTVNLKCWKKSQPLPAIDLIITSLAEIRLILLSSYTLFTIDLLSSQSITKMNIFPEYTVTVAMVVEFCSLWWGSVLCVFYCVKITNYNNRLFMRLKMKISEMAPRLLLISLVPSILGSLPYKWVVFSSSSFNGTDGRTGVKKTHWFNHFILRCAGSVIPFVIFCVAVVLLIVSLLRHTRNLGSRGSGFSDAQRDVHLSVIRNMMSFLLLYVLHFLGANLLPFSVLFKTQLLTVLCCILCVTFPSLHSISLIISNRELKNAFLTALRCSWRRDEALGT